jgi:hypothetical protein
MNTKYVMSSSAVVTGFAGLTASFFPIEILKMTGATTNEWPVLFIQITGALYLGFAIMNWMARTCMGCHYCVLRLRNTFWFGSFYKPKTSSCQQDLICCFL